MRVLAVFPYPTLPCRQGTTNGAVADTFLMGVNHLGNEVQVDFLDPSISRASNVLWSLTRLGPIKERYFAANLVQQLRALGRSGDYDALVLRDIKNVFLPAVFRRVLGKRTFTLLLDATVSGNGRYDNILAPFLQGVDIVTHNTRAMSSILKDRMGVEEIRLQYLPYGVDAAFFSPRDVEPQNGIVSVGDTNRDYETLLRALKRLGLRCRIFATRVLPLPGRTAFDLGSVPVSVAIVSAIEPSSLRNEYARAKIVVVPLHESPTGSGVTSVLEAMSMERATVVAGTTGMSDYVEDGKSAITYRPGDHLDLARQIEYLLQDSETARRLGREARTRVLGSFSTVREGEIVKQILKTGAGPNAGT